MNNERVMKRFGAEIDQSQRGHCAATGGRQMMIELD